MRGTFVPWLYAIGSSVRNVSLRDMAEDPVAMASAVVDSSKLFKTTMVCVNFDPTLWAEAAGCGTDWQAMPTTAPGGSADPNPDAVKEAPRIATLVDAIARVKGALPNQPVSCAMPGPATLASVLELGIPPARMDQFTVGELAGEFASVLCEAQVDNIVIVEDPRCDEDALAPWVESGQYARIAKLTDHYSVASTLLCPQLSLTQAHIAEFDSLTYVVAESGSTAAAHFDHAIKGFCVEGFGTGNVKATGELGALEPDSYFLTTRWDLDPDTDLADIQQDIATVQELLARR